MQNKENKGAAKNARDMIDIASGEYIALLASDDWIKEDKIDKQIKYMKKNNLDCLYAPVIKYFQETGEYEIQDGKRKQSMIVDNSYKKLFFTTGEALGLMQSGMFKKNVLDALYYREGFVADDFLFYTLLVQSAYKVGYINEASVFYRIHNTNTYNNAEYCLYEYELPVIMKFAPTQYKNNMISNSYRQQSYKLLKSDYIMAIKWQFLSVKYHFDLKFILQMIKYDITELLIRIKIYPILFFIKHHKKYRRK